VIEVFAQRPAPFVRARADEEAAVVGADTQRRLALGQADHAGQGMALVYGQDCRHLDAAGGAVELDCARARIDTDDCHG